MTASPARLLPIAGELRALFRSAGYTVDGIGALLGPEAMAALGRDDTVPARAAARGDSELELLVRLFLLGLDEPAASADFLPTEVLETAGEGRVRAVIDLRPHEDDWWVAADFARVHPPAADHVIGIGAASMTLLTATLRARVDSALDLGTGCGIQALHLTRTANRVTATDATERSIAMARLTFALSGLDADRVELLRGDYFAPVAGRRFDLVVSNPPFVMGPAEGPALTYRDAPGGDDSALGPLLEEAAGVLAPDGVAQVLTSWVVPVGGGWEERIASALPARCDALVLLREVLDPAEHVMLWRDHGEPEPAATERALRWLAHLHGLGAEGVAYGLVVLRRTDAAPRVRLLDLTGEPAMASGGRIGGWLERAGALRDFAGQAAGQMLRAADGLRLTEESMPGDDGWQPVERRVSASTALPETAGVDPITVALLAGCDGRLPLGAVAELLALSTGVPADAVIRVAGQLVETGHLTVAGGVQR